MNNSYTWSSTAWAANGTAYTVFLAGLNVAPSFAGYSDWRLPIISELQSILVGPGVTTVSNESLDPPDPAMGTNPTIQSETCVGSPCIDTGFSDIGGPTAAEWYWSANGVIYGANDLAMIADFGDGTVGYNWGTKAHARAVRTDSCTE